MPEERVNEEEAREWAYEEVEEAETWSPELFWEEGGFEPLEGLARTEKRTGSSLRWSKIRCWEGAGLRGT